MIATYLCGHQIDVPDEIDLAEIAADLGQICPACCEERWTVTDPHVAHMSAGETMGNGPIR